MLDIGKTSPFPSLSRHYLLYSSSSNQKYNLVRPKYLPPLYMPEYIYDCLKESSVNLVGSKIRFLTSDTTKITPLL